MDRGDVTGLIWSDGMARQGKYSVQFLQPLVSFFLGFDGMKWLMSIGSLWGFS